MDNGNIEEFCGPTPEDFEPVEITNNEFIFENDPKLFIFKINEVS